jgi:CHASE2 domain-containing sensor protein
MDRSNTKSDDRRANFALTMVALLAAWLLGGFVALLTVHWDSMTLTTRGHLVTIWLMVAFLFVAGTYLAFAWMSRLRVVPLVIMILLIVIEVILVLSYFSW